MEHMEVSFQFLTFQGLVTHSPGRYATNVYDGFPPIGCLLLVSRHMMRASTSCDVAHVFGLRLYGTYTKLQLIKRHQNIYVHQCSTEINVHSTVCLRFFPTTFNATPGQFIFAKSLAIPGT